MRLTHVDRILWVWMSQVWDGWQDVIVIVKPETVLAWHRRGFRLFWTWKSRRRLGRPSVPRDVREAFPADEVPRYLIRDRDAAFAGIGPTATGMGIHEVLTAPRSPWQNAYAERLIGSIRRECLDHVIVVNETGLSRVLSRYLAYYHHSRTHLSLAKDSPAASADRATNDRPGRRHSTGRRPPPSLRPSGGVVTLPCHLPGRRSRNGRRSSHI